MKRICIVDDEPAICQSLEQILTDEEFTVEVYPDLESFEDRLKAPLPPFDIILLDIWFKKGDGIAFLQQHHSLTRHTPVIIMSGHGTIETAVQSTKLGAYDFLEKPISYEKLIHTCEKALEHYELVREREHLRTSVAVDLGLVGASPVFTQALDLAIKAAASNANVFVEGENGSGKELFSRFIHRLSSREKEPFVTFNCAAVPDSLIEAELFGYEKGAFTGAVKQSIGLLECAHRGTLFLDEIGDMPLSMQSKLLRVLQEHRITRIGGTQEIPLDFRVISATNKDIRSLVQDGKFREDLYYRVHVIPFCVPPLRDRPEDIPLLLNYFSREIRQKGGSQVIPVFTEASLSLLQSYNWPGNVRQLSNFLERVMVFADGGKITEDHVKTLLADSSASESMPLDQPQQETPLEDYIRTEDNYRKAKELFEKHYFEQKLRKYKGNMSRVAQEIGLERSHLYKKLRQLGISYDAQQE
jgi:two-component system, NtrC family, nitrogen regulation response regulator NtrX